MFRATTMKTTATGGSNRNIAPGPRGHPLLGVLPDFRRDPLGLCLNTARQYGDVVRLRFAWNNIYFFNHPDHTQHVLQENNRNYKRPTVSNDLFKLASGENLFTSDGDYWLRQRRLMQPAFHRQRIAAFGTLMTETTLAMLDRWRAVPSGQPLDIEQEMMRLTLSIVGQALFSVDLSDDASAFGQAFTTSAEYLTYRMSTLLVAPLFIPTRRNRAFQQAVQTVNQLVDKMIQERRTPHLLPPPAGGEQEAGGDLLSMLMKARDEETGAGMTDEQLRHEVFAMIFAGHETTANTLTWTFYLLAEHPPIERKLHAELAEVLGGRVPTVQDLPSLRYTRMVIEEALRLYPPAWSLWREAIGDDEVGGYRIPARSSITLMPYVMHRDPRFWENPAQFEPERFTPERAAERPTFAYLPFGGGPRKCIGNTFALTEAQLVLATIAQRYRLRLVPGHPVEPVALIVLRTRYGLPMMLHRPG